MTTPTGRQVKGILWREVRRLYYRSKIQLGGELSKDPGTGWRFNDGRELVGFATNEAERMSGYSGAELFYIVDEATGIAEEIFESIQGNRAGGAKLLMTSNPTQVSGTFYESFTTKKALYQTVHVSSYESPNVKASRIVIPGLATAPWIDERQQDWGGEGSPVFDVRVLGNFPSEAWNAIISLTLVEQARAHWTGELNHARLSLGVDVARYGDDETVIAPVRGLTAYQLRAFRSMDSQEVADKVLQTVRELRLPDERPLVNVDVIGVGSGVYDILKRHPRLLEAVPVDSAARAQDFDNYHNRRTELIYGLRDWLREGGTIPPDAKLDGELVATTYKLDSRGRHQAEPKDEVKKRLHRSPDRQDSLALSVTREKNLLPESLELDFGTQSAPFGYKD